MAELVARGGVLIGAVHHIEQRCDAEQKAKIYGRFSPELKKTISNLDKHAWYPRNYLAEMWDGLASLHGDPVTSHHELIQCGRAHGQEATASFMRLLVKFLTPKAFARKFPDFWSKDFKFGTVETDISKLDSNRTVIIHVREVDGFDHLGPVTAGYLAHGFEAMGKTRVKVEEKRCPVTERWAPEYEFHVSWAA